MTTNAKKGRIFSGMRPSGRLHLGNHIGALQNWVNLQKEYECIYCAVDIHALTDTASKEAALQIQPNIYEMVLDWLAAGLDPEKSIIFVQSHVREVMVLHGILSMFTPMGWLMRVPTFKEKLRQLDATEHTVSYGLVGYPVLMTADIVLYKADTVPVGEDQLPHLELAREVVRRFNHLFGPTFPEPKAKLTTYPLVIGLDGQSKMSKSLDNHIELAASPEETAKKVMTAVTDPNRKFLADPGRPEICNVFALHKYFNPDQVNQIHQQCTSASIGCVQDKQLLAKGINDKLRDLRERRQELASKKGLVEEVLMHGAAKAQTIAKETLGQVMERIGLA